MDPVSALPDPTDRTAVWVADGMPAYQAWWETLTATVGTEATQHAKARGLFVHYGEAVPTLDALHALLELGSIVEVAAGTGYWARLLRDLGGDVAASDLNPGAWNRPAEPWTQIDQCDAHKAATAAPERVLLIIWPLRDGFLEQLLRDAPQQRLALVTDGPLRFMGEALHDPAWEALQEGWLTEQTIEIPRWPYRSDRLTIHRRR